MFVSSSFSFISVLYVIILNISESDTAYDVYLSVPHITIMYL